jgi:hypothetical protein
MLATAIGQGGLRLAAITGLDTAVVSWDVPDPKFKGGLIGFTAFLVDATKGKGWFLKNHRDNGSSHRYPIQRFRWTIYGLRPGGTYSLYVWPVFEGTGLVPVEAASDRRGPMPTGVAMNRAGKLAFTTETNDQRLIQIQTNRGTYAMPSPPRLAGAEGEEGERRFLGRGLDEFIAGFAVFAGSDDRDVSVLAHAIDDPVIGQAIGGLKAARIITDEQAPANAASDALKALRKIRRKSFQLTAKSDTTFASTQNVIITKGDNGEPSAVMTSSADFTIEGLFAQANHALVIAHGGVASAFQERFDLLWGDGGDGAIVDRKAAKAAASSKGFIELDIPDGDGTVPLELTFAPHAWAPRAKSGMDYTRVAALIGAAKQGVFFASAAMDDPTIVKAIKDAAARGVTVFGLVDRAAEAPDTLGFVSPANLDRTESSSLTHGAALGPEAFPAWTGCPDVRIHHHVIAIDPGTPEAVTIISSGDFTAAASKVDDNHLMILKDQRVADIFYSEIIRLYDTYRYRFVIGPDGKAHRDERPDAWWAHAFQGPGAIARNLFLPNAPEVRGGSPAGGLSGRERRAAIRKKHAAKLAKA